MSVHTHIYIYIVQNLTCQCTCRTYGGGNVRVNNVRLLETQMLDEMPMRALICEAVCQVISEDSRSIQRPFLPPNLSGWGSLEFLKSVP